MEKDQLIYGIRPLIEAINAGKDVDKILIQNGLKSELFHEFRSLLAQRNIPYQFVPIEKLKRVTTKNHQGVIGFVSNIVYSEVENIVPFVFEQGHMPLIIILDRITDVRNFGAIARSAECAGADAIVIPYFNSVRVSADAIKSSAGALHKIPVCRSLSMIKTVEFLKSSGLQIVACTEKAQQPYYNCNFNLPTAIIMGSEDDGISDVLLKAADHKFKIEMVGEIQSLNVSVATGIVLFEALKQRTTAESL
ncbi:MAG: 23S rRNA (guanosine(2251)-2'-O)-methyltransferase RlmB [Bacteroidota bacterium]